MMLFNINKYLFARTIIPLKKSAINKNFNSDPKLAFERLLIYEQKLSMRRAASLKLFKRQPTIFKSESESNKVFESKIQLVKSFGPKYQFLIDVAPYMSKVLYYMKDQDIKNIYTKCQQFEISEDQGRKIFSNATNVLNPMFAHIMDKKYQIFQDYMNLNKQQFINLLVDAPYLLSASQSVLRQTVIFLVYEQPLTKQQILEFAKHFGDIFLFGRHYIQSLLTTFRGWDIPKKQIWKMFQKHPLLLLNEPKLILPKKIKIMRFFKFTKNMAKQLFVNYPDVMLWSVQSLQAKLFFIRDRLDLPINSNTLPLLRYKFNETLRPRGQIVFKSKERYNENNIESYMKMTQQQFINHFKRINHISTIFYDQKARYPATREIDLKKNRRIKTARRIPQILKMYIPYEKANGSYKEQSQK